MGKSIIVFNYDLSTQAAITQIIDKKSISFYISNTKTFKMSPTIFKLHVMIQINKS